MIHIGYVSFVCLLGSHNIYGLFQLFFSKISKITTDLDFAVCRPFIIVITPYRSAS